MHRDPVASSNIVSIGYDPPSETLEVEFQKGTVYQFYNVPTSIYEAIMAAHSKGQFFVSQIRNSYPFARV